MLKKYFFVGLLFIIFSLAGCRSGEKEQQDTIVEENIPVKVIPLVQVSNTTTFESSGYFTTDDETPLSFKNGGIIRKIFVQEGDAIRKGQIIATVNTTEINAAAQQARAALEKAQRDYQRASNLYRDSVATLEQMQNARTALDVVQHQMEAINYNVQQTQLRAVKNGFVLKKYLNEGQLAGPGMPVFLVNGGAGNNWVFKTGVTDLQWAVLSIGDSATIKTDVAPDRPLAAIVSKKSGGVDPQSGAFQIQLEFADRRNIPIASGLFGRAVFHPSHKTEGWKIPFESILDGDEHAAFVFVTNDKKTAKKIKVSISEVDHGGVIVQSGLEGAQYLITTGNAYLKDGSTISVIQ